MTDLHIHTTYCDGKNTPEEYVLEGIKRGFKRMGFSTHSYTSFDESYCIPKERINEYKDEIRFLKEKYKDKIEILLGVEMDYFSDMDKTGFDYIIGSAHYVKKDGVYITVDYSKEYLISAVDKYYNGDFYAFTTDYFKIMGDMQRKHSPLFIGHFDLVTKFNENMELFDETDERYIVPALDAVRKLVSENAVIELNTGAISRGYRTKPYPSEPIIKEILKLGGKLFYSSDSHNKENIGYYYKEAMELVGQFL